jgi:VanZ family protein
VAIFVLLWMPPPPPPEIGWPWWDSLVHAGLFASFGTLWVLGGAAILRVLALGAVVGAVTELGQDHLPWERHGSGSDFAFDLLGTALGVALARLALRARNRPATE